MSIVLIKCSVCSRYIITREPLGSANKHLTDQTALILNLQADIKQIQVIKYRIIVILKNASLIFF